MPCFHRPLLAALALATLAGCDETTELTQVTNTTNTTTHASFEVRATFAGRYASGIFNGSAAEIVTFHPATQRTFVVNASSGEVDFINAANLAAPILFATLDVAADVDGAITAVTSTTQLGAANSVAIHGDRLAVAIEANPKQGNGYVAFYRATDLVFLGAVEVGALPDMLTFTPDGNRVLVANEGEPSDDYSNDPEGSVSIIDVSAGIAAATVTPVRFTAFNAGGARAAELPAGVRIYGPGASVAQDLEPEYITVSADGSTAWVALQENNAIAAIDITTASITKIMALGFKDHSLPGNALDAGDRDGIANGPRINIRNWPVFGIYQPDSMASYTFAGQTYLVMANEGDTRDYSAFSEESRVSALTLDATLDPDGTLKTNAKLARLTVTTTLGDNDNDGDHDALYVPGARSFSIRDTDGNLVWDSGDDFERIIAQRIPLFFNASNADNALDSRSDNKGPEPEALALGVINGRTFAFVGLERMGGIMIYDISNPESPRFVQYVLDRDFTQPVNTAAAGDLGPESIHFVPADANPDGKPLLVVGNEISGTTAFYAIDIVNL